MTDACKHPIIQTWRFKDSMDVAPLWSCVDCGRRFAPLGAAAAPPVPLTDEQIDMITAEQWGAGLGAPYAAYRAYARAIEAAHGIAPDAQQESKP